MAECVTCRSPRVERFLDAYGTRRIFCRSCWVSFPERDLLTEDPRRNVHANVAAVMRID